MKKKIEYPKDEDGIFCKPGSGAWALMMLYKGKKIRAAHWDNERYIFYYNDDFYDQNNVSIGSHEFSDAVVNTFQWKLVSGAIRKTSGYINIYRNGTTSGLYSSRKAARHGASRTKGRVACVFIKAKEGTGL